MLFYVQIYAYAACKQYALSIFDLVSSFFNQYTNLAPPVKSAWSE